MRTDESIKNSGQLGLPGPDPVFGIGGEGETPIDLIHHNSLHYSKRFVAITEEDYNRPTCKGAGSFQTWGIAGKRLALLDLFTTELDNLVQGKGWAPVTGLCSAHYFDERDGLVAIGWYEEGTRFLDVRDPAGIRQVGYWVPTKGETWAVLLPADRPDRRDRLRARLRARHRRAPLRPRRPPRPARARAALVAARPARLAGHRRRAHRPHAEDRLRLRLPAAEPAQRRGAEAGAARPRAAGAARAAASRARLARRAGEVALARPDQDVALAAEVAHHDATAADPGERAVAAVAR